MSTTMNAERYERKIEQLEQRIADRDLIIANQRRDIERLKAKLYDDDPYSFDDIVLDRRPVVINATSRFAS